MDELSTRFWTDIAARIGGPMTFRFILQPTMAAIAAWRDGVKDARAGRPAYFWSIFNNPDARRHLLEEGWKATARIVALGIVMDSLYQILVLKWIYVGELAVIVLRLAFVPYLLLRGPINRIARRWIAR